MKISQDFLEKFAKVSGDFNPIHLNEKYAKNSYFSTQIVYGIVLLFCSLEMNLKNKKGIFNLEKIDVKFLDFVKKDSLFCIKNIKKENIKLDDGLIVKKIICQIIQKGQIMAKFDFILKEQNTKNKNEIESKLKKDSMFFYSAKKHINLPCFNIDFSFGLDSIESTKQEEMKYNSLEFAELFPNCAKKLEYNQIAALLLSTKIVGMKYPGEFSIYSSLFWNKEKFNYKGKIKAFIRPQIPANKTIIELKEKYENILQKCNLKKEKALVIGASSGLGNVFAKMLSIGGAEVLGSYFSKELDFNIKSFYFNAQKITKESLQKIAQFQPSSVFYFATPKIVAKKFSKNDLLAFLDIYIFGLNHILNICSPKIIFAPSSIFVKEMPKDFSSYIIAKSAMETYLQILAKERQIKIYTPRLEKIQTAQTLQILPQSLLSPQDVALKEIIKIFGGGEN